MANTDVPGPVPPRDDAVPETYAVRVTEDTIHVWDYRATVADPDGDWQFVETLDRDDDPRLSLEYAELRRVCGTVARPEWLLTVTCCWDRYGR